MCISVLVDCFLKALLKLVFFFSGVACRGCISSYETYGCVAGKCGAHDSIRNVLNVFHARFKEVANSNYNPVMFHWASTFCSDSVAFVRLSVVPRACNVLCIVRAIAYLRVVNCCLRYN